MRVTRALGAGNSFYIIYDFENKILESDVPSLATYFCGTKFFNFETDGLFVLKKRAGFDFEWLFYNKDGSPAEMCGNAARCAVFYFSCETKKTGLVRFLAGKEIVNGLALTKNEVEVSLRNATGHKNIENILGVSGYFVNTGVPHFVVEGKKDFTLAKNLRHHEQFNPTGTNVTFIEIQSGSSVSAITYERGVEDFTRACGTGALAAAEWLKARQPNTAQVSVEMPGGKLYVSWQKETTVLRGPAEVQFTIEGEIKNGFKV